jgi:hypothetical protein
VQCIASHPSRVRPPPKQPRNAHLDALEVGRRSGRRGRRRSIEKKENATSVTSKPRGVPSLFLFWGAKELVFRPLARSASDVERG